MEFLTPLFAIAGGIAAAIPVALHMLRKAPTDEMPFSLVRFLNPARPRLTKRSNIEYWPLMLLRMLALILLGLGFARPFIREVIPLQASENEVISVAIILDKSASMKRDGIRDQAINAVQSAIEELKPTDLLTLAQFSDSCRIQIRPEQWAAASSAERDQLVADLVDNYEPDWAGTNTGLALQTVADSLTVENTQQRNVTQRKIVLITDFQRGSQLEELQTSDWPPEVSVTLKIVAADPVGNAGVAVIEDTNTDRSVIRVSNSGDATVTDLELQPFDSSGEAIGDSIPINVAPGGRRSIPIPTLEDTNRILAGVELKNDPHPFDNVIDLPEYSRPSTTVAHIGSFVLNDRKSMRYYLQRVLSGNTARDVQLVDLMQPDDVIIPVPDTISLLVVTDVIPTKLLPSVKALLKRSGTLLVAASNTDLYAQVAQLAGIKWTVQEAEVTDYAMLANVEYEHPLFDAFKEAQFADFSSIRFFRHRSVQISDPDDQPISVLASFDSGQPALMEIRPQDNGRLFVLASGWNPADSQMALSTRFPPLLTRILEIADPVSTSFVNISIGTQLAASEFVDSDQWSIQTPSGNKVTAADASVIDGRFQPTTPGRYVIVNEKNLESSTIIVSVPDRESRTEPLPLGQLQAMNIPAEVSSDRNGIAAASLKPGQLNSAQLENQQKYWRWFLLAGLVCLAIESIWSSLLERQAPPLAEN